MNRTRNAEAYCTQMGCITVIILLMILVAFFFCWLTDLMWLWIIVVFSFVTLMVYAIARTDRGEK